MGTDHTRAANGLALADGISPARAAAWKATITTAAERATKPSTIAERHAALRPSHESSVTGCLRASVAMTDGSAAAITGSPRFWMSSRRVEPALTSVHE